jgi:hypothetical protein
MVFSFTKKQKRAFREFILGTTTETVILSITVLTFPVSKHLIG